MALRSESEYESEMFLDEMEQERARLREELELLRSQDASLHEEVCTAAKVTYDISIILHSSVCVYIKFRL